MEPTQKKRDLTIWSFVGFIFIIYGVVITGTGIYYKFYPPTNTALFHSNPSFWWGLFLLIVGSVFSRIDFKNR